jgi:CPA2 family monovalent cation:H+ antiporter-2
VGIAVGAAKLFGVSFALGAFFAGIVVSSGSELGEKTAQDLLPLQDVFAVLFFVSVGMLFDPSILWREPVRIMAVLGIVLVGKTLAAFAIVLFFKHKVRTAFVISASLAQVGEFSFILAGLGISLMVLPEEARSLILAAALISIALNGVVFRFATGLHERVERKETLLVALEHGREKWQQEQRNMSR